MKLDDLGRALWRKVSLPQKCAFFAALVGGYVTHLYAFTNLIPNGDGLSRVYDLQQMTVSGRWFLHYATSLNNFTQMPAVIGLLSLLLLGLAAALTVEVLKLRSAALGGLCGAVMACFPCVGYTFLYMFTASAYCLAIFLAVLSVWLAGRGKGGFLLGVLLLAMAMGTYQVYVTVAIALSVLSVMRKVMERETTFRDDLLYGLKLMAYIALGAVLYYVILLIFLKVKDLELLSYLGMDAASSGYPIGQLPRLVLDTYKQVIAFFFLPGSAHSFGNSFFLVLNCLALALGGIWALAWLKGEKREAWRVITLLGLLAVFPLAVNFGQIISPYSVPTPIMKFAYVFVYLAVLALADAAEGSLWGNESRAQALSAAMAVWTAALLLFCLNTNNTLYTASAQAHRAAESYLTRLMGRVEACEGYEPGMEVVFVGAIPDDQIRSAVESYAQVDHYSVPIHNVAELNKHIYYYLNDWLSVPVEEPEEEDVIALAAGPEFEAMPLYPAQGSVQVLEGRVVVKLREEYTPKSDFEIAYENRR